MEKELVKKDARRRRGVLALGTLIYAALYALCSQIDETWTIAWGTAAVRFVIALPVALAALLLLMRYALPRIEMKPDGKAGKPFCTWGAFLVLMFCYGLMFLVEYPGSFTYDTVYQVYQFASNSYSTFHPLLHTLLIQFCVSFYDLFNSMELCGALYSLIQLTIVSFCFAQACASLSRSVSRLAARLSLAFFALYPTHLIFACSCTKDVLFSAFLTVFLALSFEEISGGLTYRRLVLMLVSGVLACLLRNNMVYAMVVWAALLLLARRPLRRVALCTVLSIALGMGANAGLKAATNADNGKIVEMCTVPIQQLARVRLYAPEKLDAWEIEVIDAVFTDDLYKKYDPTISDPIKYNMKDGVFEENFSDFMKVWASVGKKCPQMYLEAFLCTALPALYPYREYKVTPKYIEISGDYGLTRPYGLQPFARPRRFAAARTWLEEHIFDTGADDVPLVRWLFNIGFIFWLLLLFVLYDMYCGRWKRVLLCMLPVLLWGTYLLGPVIQGRYLYPFICMLPLFVFRRRAMAQSDKEDDIHAL